MEEVRRGEEQTCLLELDDLSCVREKFEIEDPSSDPDSQKVSAACALSHMKPSSQESPGRSLVATPDGMEISRWNGLSLLTPDPWRSRDGWLVSTTSTI